MTPPRGVVRPAIQGALTGLLLALAWLGAVGRWRAVRRASKGVSGDPVRVCGGHPEQECFPACVPRRVSR